MTAKTVFKDVDLHCEINNAAHHTNEVSEKVLIVRRGQPFTVTVTLSEPFKNSAAQPLFIRVNIGKDATEEAGTLCILSIPNGVPRSPNAKAVWAVEQDRKSSPYTGVLVLNFTPPADAPIGQFYLTAKYGDEEKALADPTVLFNPWCPEDAVFMKDEMKRQEYVMNEHGIIYRGSMDYIMDLDWDFGQFEENMLEICISLLRISNEHQENPAEDLAKRADPTYVGRLISAMINSQDDYGVLEGRWGGSYSAGHKPTHWTGSSAILSQWLKKEFKPVKYGQCWVFAGVMCSVMRFLGIPCRVITNFNSAHDTDANLSIDRFTAEEGAMEIETTDSIWNFHVWVEGWMTRPDLGLNGKYDGWQVLDPTPQELSGGVFCCGPASKTAILNGVTTADYDVPFVFAEVNADINVWMTKVNYTLEKVESDNERVGKNISTKAEGTDIRLDITNTYKAKEGTFSERLTYARAIISNYKALREMREKERKERERRERERRERERRERESRTPASTAALEDEGINGETEESGEAVTPQPTEDREEMEADALDGGPAARTTGTTEASPASTTPVGVDAVDRSSEPRTEETADDTPPPPKVVMKFEEVTKPMNGQDVELNLVLSSKSTADRPLIIVLEINTMRYFGQLGNKISRKTSVETLKPGLPLVIPIKVLFSDYAGPMLDSDSLRVRALVLDQVKPHHPYIKESNVVLKDPPLEVNLLSEARLLKPTDVEVVFMNPVGVTLTNCTLTISGSGLEKGEFETRVQDLKPSMRLRMRFSITPYKVGQKTLTADFDCSHFRDIKGKCIINVKP